MGPGARRDDVWRYERTPVDRDFLIDLFSDFGPVTIRRMFSGFGISADGTNFALALRSGLYFASMKRPFRNSRRKDQSRSNIQPAPKRSR